MLREVLRSKIENLRVTETALNYEGSITLDEELLERADIIPGEKVTVMNLENGSTFDTYAIAAPRGSGTVCLNGPAARLGEVGDRIVALAYSTLKDGEKVQMPMKIVKADRKDETPGCQTS